MSSQRFLAIVVLNLFFAGCTTQPQRGPASYFAFKGTDPNDLFIIELNDPAKIQEARNILNGTEARKTHVSGRIVKQKAFYNPNWSFYLDPDSITFFELATEACDANMRYVEQHLNLVGDSFLPDKRWCPWASILVREIPSVKN
jgi:hypothetical protein